MKTIYRIAKIVMEELKPYTIENGGLLKVEHISYFEGRGNVIITYPGSTDKTVTLIGSHMDVVPADPETWTVPPFELTRNGDKLYGRGSTDCLGHVALVTLFFVELAIKSLSLSLSLTHTHTHTLSLSLSFSLSLSLSLSLYVCVYVCLCVYVWFSLSSLSLAIFL